MACHPCPLAHLVSWWWFLGWTSWMVRGPRGWRLTHAGGTMSPASTQSPGRSPVLCRQLWSSGPLLEHRRETWESYGASVRFPSVENGIQASSLSLSLTHTHTRTHTCMHARTHAHTHTHTMFRSAPPRLVEVFSVLPLKQFQCSTDLADLSWNTGKSESTAPEFSWKWYPSTQIKNWKNW